MLYITDVSSNRWGCKKKIIMQRWTTMWLWACKHTGWSVADRQIPEITFYRAIQWLQFDSMFFDCGKEKIPGPPHMEIKSRTVLLSGDGAAHLTTTLSLYRSQKFALWASMSHSTTQKNWHNVRQRSLYSNHLAMEWNLQRLRWQSQYGQSMTRMWTPSNMF